MVPSPSGSYFVPVEAVDEIEHRLATNVLMAHIIYKSDIARASLLILVHVDVSILAPVLVDVGHTVPVLAAEGYALADMTFEQCHVDDVIRLGADG